ncbi:uncharacterized protein TEOVI_000083500 [Trypanosoma equiperdum]|uniref:Uncharacterized protein n=2 Tax=Trypanozoon TaxID=39700 RepID=Q38A22_TRYB2|nr:hypothetical protein Tb10.6k15.0850 [Trypanosoma brucei brucei TREU927]EAN78348.1 hypothetical protein Tb10.6k15.0850 [Trypanosoma brucei brucei TREU927]SCU69269.1 hypothetical protein, conserved [Trypanosoma equiperdum]
MWNAMRAPSQTEKGLFLATMACGCAPTSLLFREKRVNTGEANLPLSMGADTLPPQRTQNPPVWRKVSQGASRFTFWRSRWIHRRTTSNKCGCGCSSSCNQQNQRSNGRNKA